MKGALAVVADRGLWGMISILGISGCYIKEEFGMWWQKVYDKWCWKGLMRVGWGERTVGGNTVGAWVLLGIAIMGWAGVWMKIAGREHA